MAFGKSWTLIFREYGLRIWVKVPKNYLEKFMNNYSGKDCEYGMYSAV